MFEKPQKKRLPIDKEFLNMERYFKITEIPESEFVKKTGARWIGVQTYGVLDDSIYIGVDCDMTSRMVVELEDLE